MAVMDVDVSLKLQQTRFCFRSKPLSTLMELYSLLTDGLLSHGLSVEL